MGKRKVTGCNKIGNHQNNKSREDALAMLDVLTAKREEDGWVWVQRGTTTKQIHPDKVKDHLADGWKIKKRYGK